MKLNPFDLEKALSGEYEIFTRDGRKVEQLFYFDKANYKPQALVAVINGHLNFYNPKGRLGYESKEVDESSDLFLAPKLVDRWINVYEKTLVSCRLFDSEEEAKNQRPEYETQTIKIEVEL